MKKACVLSYGCPENLADSSRVRAYLKENDWRIVDDFTVADLILFNTCALTSESTSISMNDISELQEKMKDNQQLIVWGCLTKIDPEALSRVYQGPTFAEGELYKLDEIINAVKPITEIIANDVCSLYQRPQHRNWSIRQLPTRLLRRLDYYLTSNIGIYRENDPSIFYIKISTGCLGDCSYCAIRKSRGVIKSKPVDKVMSEFRLGFSQGFQNFSLLGTDLGPYGRDLGCTLADLLKEMVKEKGEYRIGLRNVHPYFLRRMLEDMQLIFSTGRIWYTGIAAESGSNRILRLMKRNYTVADFKECIHRLKRACPDLFITTQLIVGFPTETEQDFAESMRLIDEAKFDTVEVYKFSPRPGTPAAEMEGQIPERIAQSREYRMLRKVLVNTMLRKVARGLRRNTLKRHNT